jgi:hypothetical protein
MADIVYISFQTETEKIASALRLKKPDVHVVEGASGARPKSGVATVSKPKKVPGEQPVILRGLVRRYISDRAKRGSWGGASSNWGAGRVPSRVWGVIPQVRPRKPRRK